MQLSWTAVELEKNDRTRILLELFLSFTSIFGSKNTPTEILSTMARVREAERARRWREAGQQSRWSLGLAAIYYGVPSAATIFSVSRGKSRYWKRKILEPTWKRGHHGGSRREFAPEVVEIVCGVLFRSVQQNPARSYRDFQADVLRETGITVSKTYIKQVFADADWTYVENLHLLA